MKTLFRFERGCDGFLSSSRLVRASLFKAPFVVLYSQRKEWKGGYNLVCHECSSCVHQVITMNLETWSEIVKWRIFLLSFFWAAVVVGCYFSVEHWFVVCLKAWGQMSIGEEEVEKKKKKILGSMGNEGSNFFKVIIFPSVLALFVSTSHMRNANRLLLNNKYTYSENSVGTNSCWFSFVCKQKNSGDPRGQ